MTLYYGWFLCYEMIDSKIEKVGITQEERWLAKSAVKNNIKDAKIKHETIGGDCESPSEGENGIYNANCKILQAVCYNNNIQCEIQDATQKVAGITLYLCVCMCLCV